MKAFGGFVALVLVITVIACGRSPAPAEWIAGAYQCQSCRMTVIDRHFSSQIAAPDGEPRLFDDLGCLTRYLERTTPPEGAVVYVADHRTGDWVRAPEAVYARVDSLTAPMGSHIVAHASVASRTADGSTRAATPIDGSQVIPEQWWTRR
jgi:copper chaperone NosL